MKIMAYDDSLSLTEGFRQKTPLVPSEMRAMAFPHVVAHHRPPADKRLFR